MITSLESFKTELDEVLAKGEVLTRCQCEELQKYLERSVHHSWDISDVETEFAIMLADNEEFSNYRGLNDSDYWALSASECIEILQRFEYNWDTRNALMEEIYKYIVDTYKLK